jgi:hypothetical protein
VDTHLPPGTRVILGLDGQPQITAASRHQQIRGTNGWMAPQLKRQTNEVRAYAPQNTEGR